MVFKIGARSVGGTVIGLPGFWLFLLWVLDTKGRIEEGVSVLNALLQIAPWWAWAFASALGIALILWERRIPHRGIELVITPLIAVLVTGALFLGALGWFFYDRSKGPIIWTYGDGPHPIYGMRGNYPQRPIIGWLQIAGTNRTDDPISNVAASARIDSKNVVFPGYFRTRGKYIKAEDATGIPPQTDFVLYFPLTNDPAKFDEYQYDADTFLAQFSPVTVTISFDGRGSPFVKRFTQTALARPIIEFEAAIRERMQREMKRGITAK